MGKALLPKLIFFDVKNHPAQDYFIAESSSLHTRTSCVSRTSTYISQLQTEWRVVEAFPRVTCHIVFHIVTFVITVLVAYFSVLHTTYDQSVRRARVNLEQTCWIDHLHSALLTENASLNKRFHPSSAICLRYNLRWY